MSEYGVKIFDTADELLASPDVDGYTKALVRSFTQTRPEPAGKSLLQSLASADLDAVSKPPDVRPLTRREIIGSLLATSALAIMPPIEPELQMVDMGFSPPPPDFFEDVARYGRGMMFFTQTGPKYLRWSDVQDPTAWD